jgi:hypothetical protein
MGERLAQMDWLTLRFDDDTFEEELVSQRVQQGTAVTSSIACLLLGCSLFTPYGQSWVHYVCVAGLILLPKWLLDHEDDLCKRWLRTDIHTFGSIVWAACWTLILAHHYWTNIRSGYGLGPDDTVEALALCFMWVMTFITQHLMHCVGWTRAVVIVSASFVCSRNSNWRYSFFIALIVGDTLGYVLERMLRQSFLHHMESIEQLRREKERIQYDFLMVQKQQQQQQEQQQQQPQQYQHQRLVPPPSPQQRPLRGMSDDGSSSAFSELASMHERMEGLNGSPTRLRQAREMSADGSSIHDGSSIPEMDMRSESTECSVESEPSVPFVCNSRMEMLWRSLEESGVQFKGKVKER